MTEPMSAAPPPTALEELRTRLTGVVAGRYTLKRTLGVGGMGAVFLAEEVGLEREVAIKVLPPKLAEDPSVVARFQREAKTAARLDHAHIIPIYRVESEGGLHYFVMKYVAGRPLDALIAARGPLPVPEAIRILSESAAALEHAHRKGVVHRDIKPANILLDQEERVLLADFGIAKALATTSELTNTGVVIGTPYYMSPEQALGTPVDGRSDQYSLAVVGYRILTGEPLFDGDSSMAILYKHIHTPPPRVRERRREVPAHVELALLRALSKAPASRFESMAAFARALRGEAPVSPAEATVESAVGDAEQALTGAATVPLEATPVPGRRRRLPLIALLGLIGAVGGGIWWQQHAASAAPAVPPGAPPVADTSRHTQVAQNPPADTTRPHPQSPAPKPAPARTAARDRGTPAPRPVDTASAPPAFTTAPLTVNATPFGTLFIDDVRIGGTPVVNYALARGDHTLRVEREGCTTKEERITVSAPGSIKRQYTLECTP